MKYLLSALLLLAAPFAHAGDASEFKPLGFSADGRYYAFAQSGSFDGSGAAYAEVSVVDVAKNDLVASKKIRFDDGNEENLGTPEKALDLAIKGARLARFGIKEGRNLGRDLLVRLPTDLSSYTSNTFSVDYWAEGGASATLPRYDVKIATKPARSDNAEGEYCASIGFEPALLTLSVEGRADSSTQGFRALLQQDSRLPKSRGCATSYSVQRVTILGDNLVVALYYSTPGFEGPDVRSMVVTGKVKL
jgi:predicted secreted protein